MILKKRIPNDFYKLFRVRNMDAYMLILTAIYEENNEVYSVLGLTVEEGQAVIRETIARAEIDWQEDAEEEDGDGPAEDAIPGPPGTPSAILNRLIRWGWLKSDYDEKLNTYVISFPEYSRLYTELFQKLRMEDDSRERESILSVYSALFTYSSDRDKNNDILGNALQTSKNLGQLLSNLQDGMRSYFDELSCRKNFIGIQEVLVEEINNSDSKKYAILTTTDSFYRYKEEVKELISRILNENEIQMRSLNQKRRELEADSAAYQRTGQAVRYCEEAVSLVCQVEREFDLIERKYKKLIEQKAIFAKRALARIHYIFQEGANDEDSILKLLALLDADPDPDTILSELQSKIRLTAPFKMFEDNSFYNRRESSEDIFLPRAVAVEEEAGGTALMDYVPRPLYTQKQLQAFREKGMKNGVFTATQGLIHTVEDLEKLLFLWQETTEKQPEEDTVLLGKELQSEEGFTFSELVIDMGEGAHA